MMTPFDRAMQAAVVLPPEDQRLLVRELSEGFSAEDRWTLIRGLVAVEPIEDWPALLNGRSADEIANVLVQMVLAFEPAQQPVVVFRIFEALAPAAQQALIQACYSEGRRRRQDGP
jgi:hypothetical protein